MSAIAMALIGVHGFEFKLHRRQDPCFAVCADIVSALDFCPESNAVACLCPPVLASAQACASCLALIDADPTDAASLASAFVICEETAVDPEPSEVPCVSQCSDIALALSVCPDEQCFCPTLTPSVSACSACLAASGDP